MNPALHSQIESAADSEEPEMPETPKHRIPLAVYVGWAITVLTMLALGSYSWGIAMTKLDQHSVDIGELKKTQDHTDRNVNRIMGKLGIGDSRE